MEELRIMRCRNRLSNRGQARPPLFLVCRRQLASYFLRGTCSCKRAKTHLCAATNGAPPGFRQVFKFDSFGDFPLPVPSLRIVQIPAVTCLALPHFFGIRHKFTLRHSIDRWVFCLKIWKEGGNRAGLHMEFFCTCSASVNFSAAVARIVILG